MKSNINLDAIGIRKLVNDKEAFRKFVYTPLPQAIEIIRERRGDKNLASAVDNFIGGDIPLIFSDGIKAVLFRQVFSPNFEFRYFLKLIESLGIDPVFLEYHDDIYTSQNPVKHRLGKMRFCDISSNGKEKILCMNVIDFNSSQGRKIKDVDTLFNQSLIDFHHELLELAYPNSAKYLFDASSWFHSKGGRAKKYYAKYISLYMRNAISFENFILEKDELRFAEEIFLPLFIDAWKAIGTKPMIVSLLPFDSENDERWMSYPQETWNCIKNKKMVE